MRAFSYAYSLLVTWLRWRLHHSICHTRKPNAAHKVHGSMFDRTRVIADQSFTLWEEEFRPFWFLRPSPWPNDLHVRTRPVDRGDTQHVQIWTSYIRAFKSYRLIDTHTDRHTDMTKIIYHATAGSQLHHTHGIKAKPWYEGRVLPVGHEASLERSTWRNDRTSVVYKAWSRCPLVHGRHDHISAEHSPCLSKPLSAHSSASSPSTWNVDKPN